MKHRFILATDGSKCSRQIISYCLDTFDTDHTSFLVTHVIQFSPANQSAYELSDPGLDNYREQVREQAEAVVEEIQRPLEEQGFATESEILVGRAGVELVELAKEREVSGILMGRKGHSQIAEMLVGSTSNYVVHHAICPVTLVPIDYYDEKHKYSPSS